MTSIAISMFKSILLSHTKCDHMTLANNMLNKIASPCIREHEPLHWEFQMSKYEVCT
jgi:hypothetical protein